MSKYNFIIDVNDGKEYSIFSNHGRSILKSYIQLYKSGGGQYTRVPSDSDGDTETRDLVGHMFRCNTTTDGTNCKYLPPLLLKKHRYDDDKENINTTDEGIVVLQEVGTDEYKLVTPDKEDPYGPNNDLRTYIYLELTKEPPKELEEALENADDEIARGDTSMNDVKVSDIPLLPKTVMDETNRRMAGRKKSVVRDAVGSPENSKKNSLLNLLKPLKRTEVKRTQVANTNTDGVDEAINEAINEGAKAIEEKKAELAGDKKELEEKRRVEAQIRAAEALQNRIARALRGDTPEGRARATRHAAEREKRRRQRALLRAKRKI